MSKTVDQRVVEMRFDNQHFEKNAKTTLSTLDKLKMKLNLSGSSKSLDNLSRSANKVNMNGLTGALNTVSSKFSAMEVIGVTALANITNSAINAGKRIVESLTIAPVKDGFTEYEMMLNSIQTTMAGTGLTAKEVEKELKKLDDYADKTVYSTADMLNNLPKFTNAGVDLEVATKAMIGIANATAHAGGDANKASIAFYNLGQAIGTGYLTRMDYNSINNAGIATMAWKEAMVEAAIAAGTLVKVDEDLYQAGNKTLTMQQLFIDGLQEQWATTDVMLKVFEDYGDETTEIGKQAYKSAQNIKTFSMMMDSLKATAGTGWKDTWQIIFGDLDEATEFWTGITDFISGVINRIADFRNKLLAGALGRTFAGLFDGIKETAEIAKEAIEPLQDYAKLVDDIISGSWGNAPTRWEDLAAAGYDWAHAQNLVNEKLGSSVRHATNYAKSQEKMANSQKKATKATTDYILELLKMSDAELKALGYTSKQISAFRELERVANKAGIPLRTFIDKIDEIDGRWILINAFENAFGGLKTIIESVKDAWVDTVGVITSDHLFEFILILHKLSTYMKVSEETADKLKRAFSGLFAVIDMIFTLTKGPIMLLARIVTLFLHSLAILPRDAIGMAAVIGDYLVKLRDWVDQVLDLTYAFGMLEPYLQTAIDGINAFFRSIAWSEPYQKFAEGLRKTKRAVIDWMKSVLEAEDIPKYIFEGLMKGLKEGVPVVIDFIINFAKAMLLGIRKILGIESPSKEFFEIGKNIMQGLFNGIQGFVKMVYTLVMSIGEKLIELIRSLDIGSIFTMAMSAGLIFTFTKIARAIDILTSPLESLDDLLFQTSKTMKTFRGVLNTFKVRIIAESVKSIAVAIAILAGSVALLSLLDQKSVWSAVKAIGVLIVLLGALTFVAGKYGNGKGLEFGKIALSLLGLAVAMAIMASALKKISKIDPTRCLQTLGGFAAIIGSLLLLMNSIGKHGDKLVAIGGTFLAIGAAFYLLAKAAKTFAKMEWEQIGKAGAALAGITVALVLFMWATNLLNRYSKPLDSLSGTLWALGGSMLMIAIAAKMLSKMEWEELGKAGVALAGLIGAIMLMMVAINLFKSKSLDLLGKTIFGIAGAMLMMTVTAKILAGMEPGELLKAGAALVVLIALIAGLIGSLENVDGSKLFKVGSTIFSMAVAIGVLALSAALLGMIDEMKLLKGVLAVGALVLMLTTLVKATKKAKNINSTLIPLTVAIGILALSLGLLAIINWQRLMASTAALSAVLGMLALAIHSTKGVTGAMKTLIGLSIVIAVLAVALGQLAKLPVENVLGSAGALSMLLLALAGIMFALNATGGMADKALIGVLGILALCIPLYMILEVLTKMDKLENATANAMALSVFMGVLALVQLACAAAGFIYTSTAGIAATGLLGMVALVGTIYLLLGALAIMENIQNASANLEALSKFLIIMTGVLTVLAIVGPLAMTGVTAVGALVAMITIVGALAVGIGYLMEKVPVIEEFLKKGISTLVGLAKGVGTIIGAFVGGLLTTVSASLPKMGQDLSDFMTNLEPFIDGAKKIDPSMMDGVKALAQAILIITGTELLDKLTSWLTGGNSIADFGTQIAELGTYLNQFATNLGNFDESKINTVTCASKAIKALAEAAAAIPNEGGLWAKLAGENSIVAFGKSLPGLATHLNGFIANLGNIDESSIASVEAAGKVISTLAEAAGEIPNEGGLWAMIAGDNGLAKFGGKLPQLGTDLNGFISNLGSFDESKITTVECAGKAIKALADIAKDIPNEGGLWASIVGDNSLADFGEKLPDLGKNIAKFISHLGICEDGQYEAIDAACKAIKSIVKLGEIDLSKTGNSMIGFGNNMVHFAKNLKKFINSLSDIKSVSIADAVTKTKDLINLAKTAAETNIPSLKTFGSSLKAIAKDGVKGFVSAMSGTAPVLEAVKAGRALVQGVIDGIDDKKSSVKKHAKKIGEAAVSNFYTETLKIKARKAGKDFVVGFAQGIADNKYLATNAASDLGKNALQAAKDAIRSNSPSKETMKIGNYFGQGLVIGIEDYATNAYGAGYGIADRAKQGLSKAISKVSALINSDMDTQPTIRPVLDLSDVKSGVGTLNSMFDNGPAIGVASNLRAISSGMNARNQNGSNSDVVSAINKLGKDLGNISGTTNNYNVNGVTYDDGSSLSDAVRTIVRAAKMERRT